MSSLAEVVEAVCVEVQARADELNRLDALAGDGDLGVTARNLTSAVLEQRDLFASDDLAGALSAAGLRVAERAPSTAGTLLASGLLGAGRALAQASPDPAHQLAELLGAAYAAISGAERPSGGAHDARRPRPSERRLGNRRGERRVGRRRAEGGRPSGKRGRLGDGTDGAPLRSGLVGAHARHGQVDAGACTIAIILDAAAWAVDAAGGWTLM